MVQVKQDSTGRVAQGDIYRDIPILRRSFIDEDKDEERLQLFPYVVILTQDCDLEQEPRQSKKEKKNDNATLISVLVAPLYNAQQVYSGKHLSDFELEMEPIHSKEKDFLRTNRWNRYHFVEFGEDIDIVDSIIDFKHYFSITLDYLISKRDTYVCSICSMFREDISLRFANYLSRIGHPPK